MHKGVQNFVSWLEEHKELPGLSLNPAASAAELALVEQRIASPLPEDQRLVLFRHNGGSLPSGQLLRAGEGGDSATILGRLEELANLFGTSSSDPEALLPFFATDEGSILAFDRSAAPVADTWPVVDVAVETGVVRLVHRTFDGWCQLCVAQWSADDFTEPFSLQKYLKQGQRHAAIEPDVSIAHATVAHALRRAGNPEGALESYLRAGSCVPAQPWCDWEALKTAVLIDDIRSAMEAAERLCSRAPQRRWLDRESTAGAVADVLGRIAGRAETRESLLRLLDQLVEQVGESEDRARVVAVRKAVFSGGPLPSPSPVRPTAVPRPPGASVEQWWEALVQAYLAGAVRDDDLLLDPAYRELRTHRDFSELLRLTRDF